MISNNLTNYIFYFISNVNIKVSWIIGTRDYPIREQYTNIYKVIENTGMVHSSEEVHQYIHKYFYKINGIKTMT